MLALPRWRKLFDPVALLPALVAAILAAPGLGFDYFWDDFFFLTRAQSDPFAYLRPDPAATFYRPLPQGIYFRLLLALGPAGGVVGHLINLALLALAAALLARLGARLAGQRVGLLAGIVFAASSAVPSLVAWVSASQDLFAIVFLLAALHLRHSGKVIASAALFACALLSKETAAVALPVLALWDWLLGQKPARLRGGALLYGGVAALWIAVHPGLHALAEAGFRTGATAYVGLEHTSQRAGHVIRYALTLVNFPAFAVTWPRRLTLAALIAAISMLVVLPRTMARIPGDPGDHRPAPARIRLVALLLALPPLLLASLLVRPWATYFAAFAVPGFALFAATYLGRVRPWTVASILGAYLFLGVWSRGIDSPGNGLVITEQRFADAADATRAVRRHFQALVPQFPAGARVLLSVGGTGTLGLHQSLHDGQALRYWYREPTLDTVQPEWRREPGRDEFLFRVTPDLQVVAIDPTTSRFRSQGSEPDREEIAKPIRSYARGLAASGALDPAVWILERMASADSARFRSYDLRLAALSLHAAHRDGEALHLLRMAPPLQRSEALDMAGKVFAEPTHNPVLDALAFWPFGVSPDDPGALRYIIGQYRIGGYHQPARVLAVRLAHLVPGDSLAEAVIAHNPLVQ